MDRNIYGGEVLCVGDLHFSDVFEGKHKDYLTNCTKVLRQILDTVEERKPSVVVFLGDIVGWSDTNIKSREVFSYFCRFFRQIHETSRIFVVRGNHDMKGYPDFQFLLDIGLVETCDYFDYYSRKGGTHEIRFHIVNYGAENEELNICDKPDVGNVVLGHNNYSISGVTNWYYDKDGIELSHLNNFKDVDLVISGHIHNPSPELVECTMSSGKSCQLFYTGCPTRPIKEKNQYNQCWYVAFEYNDETKETDYDMIPMELGDWETLFYDDEEIIQTKSDEEIQEEVRKEALSEVLSDIMKYRMLQGDPLAQIDKIPDASDEAKQVAKDYLQVAINNERVV